MEEGEEREDNYRGEWQSGDLSARELSSNLNQEAGQPADLVPPPSRSSGGSREPAASAVGKASKRNFHVVTGKEMLAGKKVEFDHRPVVVSVEATLQ